MCDLERSLHKFNEARSKAQLEACESQAAHLQFLKNNQINNNDKPKDASQLKNSTTKAAAAAYQ